MEDRRWTNSFNGLPLSPYPLPVRSSRGEGEDQLFLSPKAYLPRPMTKNGERVRGEGLFRINIAIVCPHDSDLSEAKPHYPAPVLELRAPGSCPDGTARRSRFPPARPHALWGGGRRTNRGD